MSNLFKKTKQPIKKDVWARPEMLVTFRAELMPMKNREERTFRIKEVMETGRVKLHGFNGEYREGEFEQINYQK